MSAAEIVPIAVTIDERTGFTLWAPPWEEDGEQWQAFLGADDKILLFESPAQLAQYLRKGDENDLSDHPDWDDVLDLELLELVPDDDHTYDLDGVYDTVASGIDRWAVRDLSGTLDLVAHMAECCDEAIIEPIAAVPEIGMLHHGPSAFAGRGGERAWDKIGLTLTGKWEGVCSALGEYLEWPVATQLDADIAAAQAQIEAAAVPVDDPEALIAAEEEAAADGVERDSTSNDDDIEIDLDDDLDDENELDDDLDDESDLDEEDDAELYQFWEDAGILPLKIALPKESFGEGEVFTLRCYLDDAPVFLGAAQTPWLFHSPDTLLDFVEGAPSVAVRQLTKRHDLVRLATWPEVVTGVRDDDQPLAIAVDDDIDLRAADDMVRTSANFDEEEFVRAADFLADIAEYAGLEDVTDLLDGDGPLGRAITQARAGEDTDLAEVTDEWDTVLASCAGAIKLIA